MYKRQEYRDSTPHSSYEDANLGDFQEFITRWDSAHLAQLQADWDNNILEVEDPEGSDNWRAETNEEKVSVISNSTSFESGFKKLINSSEVLHDRLIL